MRERPAGEADARISAGQHLLALAESLSERERAALRVLLARASRNPAQAQLGLSPPEAVLEAAEVTAYRELQPLRIRSDAPAETSVLTVILKTTRLCNLRCAYCHSWKSGPNQVMSFPVLARTIRSALNQPGVRRVEFVWHGGEATLLPLRFYRKVLWLQSQFRKPGQIVANSVQTNGSRLTDEWLDFLRTYDIGVGISLDGPPEIHDLRRLDVRGRPTSAIVRDSVKRLLASGIRGTGILLVVDEAVVRLGARRVLDYLLELEAPGVALLNVIPDNTPIGAPLQGSYLPFPSYVEFLRDLFRLWWPQHARQIRIRELSALMDGLQGGPPGICIFAGDCFGKYLTVEPTGEVSACDKYIGDSEYTFGNVLTSSFAELQVSPALASVKSENRRAVDVVAACPWFAVCRGACPHDRYTSTRHLAGYDGRCCGLAPLLEEMASTIGSLEPESSSRHMSSIHSG